MAIKLPFGAEIVNPKDWYNSTGVGQRRSKDWRKMARADFKSSTDPLRLFWDNEPFFDKKTGMRPGEELPEWTKKSKKRAKSYSNKQKMRNKYRKTSDKGYKKGGEVKCATRPRGKVKPAKMKSGGKVSCRGMGCATRGGMYHKDG